MCGCLLFSRYLFLVSLYLLVADANSVPLYLPGYSKRYLVGSKSPAISEGFCLQTMSTTLDNLTRDEDAYVGMIEEKKVSQSKRAFLPVCV